MVWWVWAASIVVGAVAVSALVKTSTNQAPPGIGEIKSPTADPSRDIPVVFGTVDVKSPNLVFYGNMSTTPIKVKSGGKK